MTESDSTGCTIADSFFGNIYLFFGVDPMSPMHRHKTLPYSRPTHHQPVVLALLLALQPQIPEDSPTSVGALLKYFPPLTGFLMGATSEVAAALCMHYYPK